MPSPRNVVFIMTDQQRFDTLGCNTGGAAWTRTPNVDALAAGGVNFVNHIVTNPVCSPSRASIFTGKYITEHGLWANGCSLPQCTNRTIPQAFSQAGFQTAHFGKLHLVPIIIRTRPHPPYGFDVCEVAEGDQQLIDDAYFHWLRQNHPDLFVSYLTEMFQQGHTKAYKSLMPEECHQTTWTTGRAIDYIRNRRNRNKPFFLSVGYFDPHHAWNPCEPYASMYDKIDVPAPKFRQGEHDKRPAPYTGFAKGLAGITREPANITPIIKANHAMCAHIDVCVGKIIQALRDEGLDKDTAVVFTADHGEFLGNHGMLWKGPYMLDDLMKVPLVAGVPGSPRQPAVVDEVTSGVDLMATLLSLGGAADGPVESGQRLLDAELAPMPDGSRGYAIAEWEANKGRPINASLRMIRTKEHKLVHYNGQSPGELYLLGEDADEFENRYDDASCADIRRQLTMQLAEHYMARKPRVPYEGGW
jgi:arylsulfatase A-like enzyme